MTQSNKYKLIFVDPKKTTEYGFYDMSDEDMKKRFDLIYKLLRESYTSPEFGEFGQVMTIITDSYPEDIKEDIK